MVGQLKNYDTHFPYLGFHWWIWNILQTKFNINWLLHISLPQMLKISVDDSVTLDFKLLNFLLQYRKSMLLLKRNIWTTLDLTKANLVALMREKQELCSISYLYLWITSNQVCHLSIVMMDIIHVNQKFAIPFRHNRKNE